MEFMNTDVATQGSIIDNCYIASVYDGVEDTKLEELCANTIKESHECNAKGVIFNFRNLHIVDTYTIKLFIDTSKVISLLGPRVIWTRLNPGVVSSILDFNVSLDGIQICHTIENGIDIVNGNAESY